MRLLLDTHVVIWWLYDNSELSNEINKAIVEPANDVCVSAVTVFEIRLKEMLGKLTIAPEWWETLAGQDFAFLSLTVDHANAMRNLPMHHRDPFDRLLLAQAHHEQLTLVTRDRHMGAYPVRVLLT